MKDQIKILLQEVDSFIPQTKEELESFRIDFLANKGKVKALFADFKNVPNEDKKESSRSSAPTA